MPTIGIDFQEFMVMPVGAPTFAEALRCGAEIFHALKSVLHAGGPIDRGRRRGRLRAGRSTPRARRSTSSTRRSSAAGYKLGDDVLLALDCAASEFFKDGAYAMEGEGKTLSPAEMADWLAELAAELSDRLDRGRHGRGRLGGLEGADRQARRRACSWSATISSSPTSKRLQRGIDQGIANSILIKVNQIGTLTETIDAVRLAQTNGYTAVMSHRSGETEDSTIADLAVALSCGQIKTGSLARSDRIGEIQPAAADRGRAGRHRALCRAGGAEGL